MEQSRDDEANRLQDAIDKVAEAETAALKECCASEQTFRMFVEANVRNAEADGYLEFNAQYPEEMTSLDAIAADFGCGFVFGFEMAMMVSEAVPKVAMVLCSGTAYTTTPSPADCCWGKG